MCEGGEALINREYVNACHLEGMKRLEKGDLEGARSFFLDASRTPSNFNMGKVNAVHPHAHIDYQLGFVSEQMGDAEEARQHFEACLTDGNRTPDVMYYIGLACRILGEYDLSTTEFEASLAMKGTLYMARVLIERNHERSCL